MDKKLFENVFDELCLKLKNDGKVERISSDFAKLKSDFERVDFLLKLEAVTDVVKIPERLLVSGRKSSEKSKQLRNDGNKLFQAKKYISALHKYTESLSYAPWSSDDATEHASSNLSLAFGNRSAVLVHLKEHELAIQDVDRAFNHRFPEELCYKLHERKSVCLVALRRCKEALDSYRAAVNSLEFSNLETNKRMQRREELDKEMKTIVEVMSERSDFLEEPNTNSSRVVLCDKNLPCPADERSNTTFCSLSGACDVRYEPDKGRFIVALRDILPGEVILKERPYSSVLLPDRYIDHCCRCYKYTLAPVPCVDCSAALYCSENCRNVAWREYHQHECKILAALWQSGVDKFAYLALRTICATPLKLSLKCGSAESTAKDLNVDNINQGLNEKCVYVWDEYKAICSFVTHDDKRTSHDLFRRSIIAIFLLRFLQSSGYFNSEADNNCLLSPDDFTNSDDPVRLENLRISDNTEKVEKCEVYSYVAGMLLSHLQSFPCNAHEISEFSLNPDAVSKSVPHELGAGIYATLSLFNHSCNPAATRNFYGDTCVVRTIRTVCSGCEISDNYGTVYAIQARDERRKKLRLQYFFDCNCEACFHDWSLFSETKPVAPAWRCIGCLSPLPHDSSPSVVDTLSRVIRCSVCGREQNFLEKLDELVKSEKIYRRAFDALLKCEVNDALPRLLDHLGVMDRILCLPWTDYSCCQEAVKQCFSVMANCVLLSEHRK